MKILIPICSFGASGGYRVLSELANHWIKSGHNVDFLVDERSIRPYFPTAANVNYFNKFGRVFSEIRPGHNFKESGNALSIYIGMWLALRNVIDDYDVVLANYSLTTYPVAFSGARKCKIFYYIQAYEPEYYELERGTKNFILESLAKYSYRFCFNKVVNSPIYLSYKEIKANNWVPPGINPSVFYGRRTPPLFSTESPVILGVVGRKEPSKGIIYALQAFEELAILDKDIQLHVAFGNLPDGWAHERVKVIKPESDAELADFYRSVDIMIAPGIVQLGACHYPVLEAMSCGTPVITTGYIPANEYNTWIVPVRDAGAIVKAVQDIRNTPTEKLLNKLKLAGSDTNEYHWDSVSKSFLKIFQE